MLKRKVIKTKIENGFIVRYEESNDGVVDIRSLPVGGGHINGQSMKPGCAFDVRGEVRITTSDEQSDAMVFGEVFADTINIGSTQNPQDDSSLASFEASKPAEASAASDSVLGNVSAAIDPEVMKLVGELEHASVSEAGLE